MQREPVSNWWWGLEPGSWPGLLEAAEGVATQRVTLPAKCSCTQAKQKLVKGGWVLGPRAANREREGNPDTGKGRRPSERSFCAGGLCFPCQEGCTKIITKSGLQSHRRTSSTRCPCSPTLLSRCPRTTGKDPPPAVVSSSALYWGSLASRALEEDRLKGRPLLVPEHTLIKGPFRADRHKKIFFKKDKYTSQTPTCTQTLVSGSAFERTQITTVSESWVLFTKRVRL